MGGAAEGEEQQNHRWAVAKMHGEAGGNSGSSRAAQGGGRVSNTADKASATKSRAGGDAATTEPQVQGAGKAKAASTGSSRGGAAATNIGAAEAPTATAHKNRKRSGIGGLGSMFWDRT